jgi:Cu(I)/Ag(I) efflux system membrane protein CusA/SilA
MIARIIEYSVRNRGIVLLGASVAAIAGILSLYTIRLDAIPDLSDVQVIVFTEYPGQAPQVVEDQVTYPLTTSMLSVPFAKVVRGYSFFGLSFVYIIFEDGTDIYWARSRVLEYLNFARNKLPSTVSPQLGPDATGVGWIYQYVLAAGNYCIDYPNGIWAHDPEGDLSRIQRPDSGGLDPSYADVDWYARVEDAPADERGTLVKIRALPTSFDRCPVDESQVASAGQDLSDLRSLQDWYLRYELAAVEGVSEVASIGGFVRQYQVTVDPNRLLAYGISIGRVRAAIRRSNIDVGGRVIETSETEYMVRGLGYIRNLEDIRLISLGATSAGSPIYLGDIATVEFGPDIRRGLADWNGEGETVGGIVIMRFGENAYQVIGRTDKRLQELEDGLPPGVGIQVAYDRSALIERAVHTLQEKLIEEMAVVALVCVIFLLHLRSALVAVFTLPLGVLLSVAAMNWLGINANIMSLGGIAIAIGVMVDASVVMVENAHKHLERDAGKKPHREIIIAAACEVGPALFYSLLIIVVSFLPVFALGEQSGRLFRPLAYTKTFAMGFSSLLAITVIPVLMEVFIRGKIRSEDKNPVSRVLIRIYRPILGAVLVRRTATLIAAAFVLVLTVLPLVGLGPIADRVEPALVRWSEQPTPLAFRRLATGAKALLTTAAEFFPGLGSEFMPPLSEGDLLYMPTTDPGISVTKAKEILQQTDKLIATFPEVHHVFGKIGRADTATDPAPLSMIETTVMLEQDKSRWRNVSVDRFFSNWPRPLRDVLGVILPLERKITTKELVYGYSDASGAHVSGLNDVVQLPGLTNAWTMPIKTRIDMLSTGIKTPVGIKIMGPDLDVLGRLAEETAAIVRALPGTLSAYPEKTVGGNYFDFELDREQLARYALTIEDVQDVIMSAMGGMNVTYTVEGLERYPVNLRYPRELRDNRAALERTLIATPTGAQVPISQLAHIQIRKGPPVIKSENARRTAWIYVDLAGIDVGSYVENAKQAVAEGVSLPSGYSIVWSGQYEYMQEAAARLKILIPLAVLVIFLLLYMHFGNLVESCVVMLSLPFALVGGVWLLWFLDLLAKFTGAEAYNLSVAVYVGFIALAGLAAETGVVMLVYLDEAYERMKREGRLNTPQDVRKAIMEGAVQRVRPKLMTVSTTLIALLPIMWATSTGSETMKRIAGPMVGGLISATVLTLVIIPVIYEVVLERRLAKEMADEEERQNNG